MCPLPILKKRERATQMESSPTTPAGPGPLRSVASSSAGALARDLPAYTVAPPIEAVVFGWGEF